MSRTPESLATRVLLSELGRAGCFTRKLAGSLFQSGVPDVYVLTPGGKHLWLEVKRSQRSTPWPDRLNWLTLFGRRDAGSQDEFIRAVCAKDPDGARVVTIHDSDDLWALYAPCERPEYSLTAVGREEVLQWILKAQ